MHPKGVIVTDTGIAVSGESWSLDDCFVMAIII